ncbi:GGDEF domain-containing protein [Actinoplanes derwentensis]|uniref:Diguanylate cyclase (GGDEF) domain-containing protein n=1 Tax=Actinoplanes derwentensis TaxID=113562 RepID=A0A1H1R8Z6_9ACTN|nr:GGDEF domain-containing protein [Actinoplanes derwentensis]GID88029.1 hypothetical protein Ade03nite_69530 [Actinoplanes derwentensis]SDS31359.1 diguanylate cyclase (GGDEF) domain-containing protein [Actinoplanes derwentensis]
MRLICLLRRTDRLTRLAIRARFERHSHRALARGLARGRRTAVLVIDLNGDVDDRLLVEFASVLRRCLPPGALPARLDGAGFAVLLPEINTPEAAYEVSGRLAAELGPILIDGRLVTLAAAIGVTVSGPAARTHDELMHRAELAMHKAKSLGPDTRWAIWQDSPDPGLSAAA